MESYCVTPVWETPTWKSYVVE